MICIFALVSSAYGQSGTLQTMREDVRGEEPLIKWPSFKLSDKDPGAHRDKSCHYEDYHGPDYKKDEVENMMETFSAGVLFCAVASPFYIPRVFLQDESDIQGFFPRFPYDHAPGYMVLEDVPGKMYAEKWSRNPRRWSGRIRFDYCDDFNDLERIEGHLLLETTSRFGIDTQTDYLQERLSGGRHDSLWLGDCNFIYRFAQSDDMQWRAGLGFNWLDDDIRTDFGFNFTYGVDFFPRKPWVFSSTLDWGTLGSAELFRIRATGGVLIRGVETFVGYEYLDIERTQSGGLITGLRFWF